MHATFEELEADFVFFCRRCGRVLTDPVSVAAGIGPECATKEIEENSNDEEE